LNQVPKGTLTSSMAAARKPGEPTSAPEADVGAASPPVPVGTPHPQVLALARALARLMARDLDQANL
jgi:hypothetical protein